MVFQRMARSFVHEAIENEPPTTCSEYDEGYVGTTKIMNPNHLLAGWTFNEDGEWGTSNGGSSSTFEELPPSSTTEEELHEIEVKKNRPPFPHPDERRSIKWSA